MESLSVTIGSGSRREVQLGREQDEEEDEPQRQFRMPQYRPQRLTLQLNYDYPLYNFIVVTLGIPLLDSFF
jgi:hypothetical protein